MLSKKTNPRSTDSEAILQNFLDSSHPVFFKNAFEGIVRTGSHAERL